jgi:hypothetical protein
VSSAFIEPLRPKPFRGDVVAAGVVVLATLAWVVRVRFADTWGDGAQLAWATVPWAFVTLLAVLAPMERDEPRAYQSVLYVASVALAIAVLSTLSALVGADATAASTATCISAALAVLSVAFAVARNSAVCTLLGASTGGYAVIAGTGWAFSPGSLGTYRWVLLGLMVVYGIAAVGQRDRRPRHGVALIDAAGIAVLLIGLSFVVAWLLAAGLQPFAGDAFSGAGRVHFFDASGDVASGGRGGGTLTGSVGWGWELLILAAGFGLIAYSSVDRQPGPAYLGVGNLIVFALITSFGVADGGATLLGWPLVLALAAAGLLAIGLRPTTPAPPPPDIDAPPARPLPLR